MFKLSELVAWLGLSEFEIFIHLFGTLCFTVLLALRIGATEAALAAASAAATSAAGIAGGGVALPVPDLVGGVVPTLFGQPLHWKVVFAPLFGADVLNAYFALIVGIRMYIAHDNKRKALHRLLWSTKCLVLVAVFECLLCLKLQGSPNLDHSEVFAPVFVLLQLVAVRACKLTG